MARGRMISNSLSTSRKMAALTTAAAPLDELCHALFMLLVSHADDRGRQQGDTWTVKQKVYPVSRRTLTEFEDALRALEQVHLIRRYGAPPRIVLEIQDFARHQTLRHPARSEWPGPDGPDPPHADIDWNAVGRTGMPGTGQRLELGAEGRKRRKRSKEGRNRADAQFSLFQYRHPDPAAARSRYLAACPHHPPCDAPQRCGQRRQLDQAVADGDVTAAGAERLLALWGVTLRTVAVPTLRPVARREKRR